MAGFPSDEDLMLRAGKGDDEAFAQLYHRHREPLLAFCYRMLRNWEDAGDVYQDTFKYIHGHAAEYRPVARFTTYLYRIARNHCIDILRKRRRWNLQPLDAVIDPPDDATPLEGTLERAEVEAGIRRALEGLPEPYREAVHLRLVQGMSYEEIAETLGCPVGTVRSRLHAGLGLLRQALKRGKPAD